MFILPFFVLFLCCCCLGSFGVWQEQVFLEHSEKEKKIATEKKVEKQTKMQNREKNGTVCIKMHQVHHLVRARS